MPRRLIFASAVLLVLAAPCAAEGEEAGSVLPTEAECAALAPDLSALGFGEVRVRALGVANLEVPFSEVDPSSFGRSPLGFSLRYDRAADGGELWLLFRKAPWQRRRVELTDSERAALGRRARHPLVVVGPWLMQFTERGTEAWHRGVSAQLGLTGKPPEEVVRTLLQRFDAVKIAQLVARFEALPVEFLPDFPTVRVEVLEPGVDGSLRARLDVQAREARWIPPEIIDPRKPWSGWVGFTVTSETGTRVAGVARGDPLLLHATGIAALPTSGGGPWTQYVKRYERDGWIGYVHAGEPGSARGPGNARRSPKVATSARIWNQELQAMVTIECPMAVGEAFPRAILDQTDLRGLIACMEAWSQKAR